MTQILERINAVVWGVPTLVLILGVGLYLSIRTGFVQIRLLPKALRTFFGSFRGKSTGDGGVSTLQALCTALAATVGTGNIAGVAGAIALGGPGAVFWIWVSALLGMMTKLAEATLAVRFRKRETDGSFSGGPMYVIESGLGKRWKWMGMLYCFFGVFAAFGVGNGTQVGAVIDSMHTALASYGYQGAKWMDILLGAWMAGLLILVLAGGARRIGSLAQLLVPAASIVYLLLGAGVLIRYADRVPGVFGMILKGAFEPEAVTGGLIGSTLCTLRFGISRGVFTNEAGMGTAGIAHGAADVKDPVQQGLMGITEVFVDTIVICTMTALVILCSGVGVPYGTDPGAALTIRAFESVYGSWVSGALTVCLCCFAFATMLGWGYYGLQCVRFLLGSRARSVFIFAQGTAVILSTLLGTGTIWLLADILNALMAIPNLIAILLLSPVLITLLKGHISQEEHRIPASDRNLPAENRLRRAHCRGHESRESFHR